jgi:hypothetical protein
VPFGRKMTVVVPIGTRKRRKMCTAEREILPIERDVSNQRATRQAHRRRMRPKRADLPLPVASTRRPLSILPNRKCSTHRSRAENFEGCLFQSSYRKSKRQQIKGPVLSEETQRISHLPDLPDSFRYGVPLHIRCTRPLRRAWLASQRSHDWPGSITIARGSDFMPGVTQVPREALLLADFVLDGQYLHFPLR